MKITKKKSIKELKKKQSLVCLTAYTRPIAELVDKIADIILVGDSLGQVLYGFKSTRDVTLDLMILHAKAVCRYATESFVVVDLPYGTYEKSKEHAYESAERIISETGASGVKIEGGEHLATTIEYLVKKKKTFKTKKDYKDINILKVQERIESKLGLKVNIQAKKNNSGKVSIEYEDLEQFELISDLLTKR